MRLQDENRAALFDYLLGIICLILVVVDFGELIDSCLVPTSIRESGSEIELLREKFEKFELALQKEAGILLS